MDKTQRTPLPITDRRGYRIQQAADYMGMTPWFVAQLVRSRRLLALKPAGSRHYIILKEDLDSLLDELKEEALLARSV
jgi:excisionase family DNA binding protein